MVACRVHPAVDFIQQRLQLGEQRLKLGARRRRRPRRPSRRWHLPDRRRAPRSRTSSSCGNRRACRKRSRKMLGVSRGGAVVAGMCVSLERR